MKKLKEKKTTSFLVGMILGIILSCTGAYAAIIYQSSQVSYSNSSSGLSSTNVQAAIDELSTKCSSSGSSGCLIGPYDPIKEESNTNSSLNFMRIRYCDGTKYSDLNDAIIQASSNGYLTELVGYILFDRGMSHYMASNFLYINLNDGGDYYSLNLKMDPYDIVDGGNTFNSSQVYKFEIDNLPEGEYVISIGSGIKADNGQLLVGAPIVIYFSVS